MTVLILPFTHYYKSEPKLQPVTLCIATQGKKKKKLVAVNLFIAEFTSYNA